jgi:hypothetical protein
MASSKRYRSLLAQAKITPVVSSPKSFRYLSRRGRNLHQPLISGAVRDSSHTNHFMIYYSRIFGKLVKTGLPFCARRTRNKFPRRA